MQNVGTFGGLCAATVAIAAIMSIGFGEWAIWIPVGLALASVAGLRHSVSRRPRR